MADNMIKQIYRFLNPAFQNVFLDYKVDAKPRYGHGRPPHAGLLKIIEAGREQYSDILKKALSYKEFIAEIKESGQEKDPEKPTWNNGYLPGLDIIMLYALISSFKPNKYIEIGSGNSTKVAYKAKKEQSLSTAILSIDPRPRAEIDGLADRLIRMPFESIDINIVGLLDENDILFVDNSHRILPNSDAMVFFMEVLPNLKKGVVVHIHDIYLPYDYPHFMCDRFYSEQYGLASFLLANPAKYQTILPNYFISQDRELSSLTAPFWECDHLRSAERHGGSYWLIIGE